MPKVTAPTQQSGGEASGSNPDFVQETPIGEDAAAQEQVDVAFAKMKSLKLILPIGQLERYYPQEVIAKSAKDKMSKLSMTQKKTMAKRARVLYPDLDEMGKTNEERIIGFFELFKVDYAPWLDEIADQKAFEQRTAEMTEGDSEREDPDDDPEDITSVKKILAGHGKLFSAITNQLKQLEAKMDNSVVNLSERTHTPPGTNQPLFPRTLSNPGYPHNTIAGGGALRRTKVHFPKISASGRSAYTGPDELDGEPGQGAYGRKLTYQAPLLPKFDPTKDWFRFKRDLDEYMSQTGHTPESAAQGGVIRQCMEGAALSWFEVKSQFWECWEDFLSSGDITYGESYGKDVAAIKGVQEPHETCHDFVWNKYRALHLFYPEMETQRAINLIRGSMRSDFRATISSARFTTIDGLATSAMNFDGDHPIIKEDTYQKTSYPKKTVQWSKPLDKNAVVEALTVSHKPVYKGGAKVAPKVGAKPWDKNKVQCHRCDQLGHYSRECKNKPTEKWLKAKTNYVKFLESTDDKFFGGDGDSMNVFMNELDLSDEDQIDQPCADDVSGSEVSLENC